jgi:D-tyrosyl-tRNA(Tyr) deacylase
MLKENYKPEKVFDGQFGAMMDVELINDGPVTIVIESDPLGVDSTTTATNDDGDETT